MPPSPPGPDGHRSAIVDHADLLLYDFGDYHPLRPERITAGLDLLRSLALWDPDREKLPAAVAEPAELRLAHADEYIRAVDEAGSGGLPAGALARFGLTSTDNPPFPDMHYASSLVAGGSLTAARAIMEGALDHAFSPAGGLHHAGRARAHGFCIYNDAAVAAAAAVLEFGARVLYLDFDSHHGDGVQWIFYSDPRVVTLSFHESGRYLFPGTGEPDEIGEGDGLGTAFNLPFFPYTRDEQWIRAVDRLVPALAQRFPADLLISNHGCDTHVWDPLTHMALTTASLRHQARIAHSLAHEHAGGRWLAVGSGGYDWRRVVPRSWAIIWAEMTGRGLPARLPEPWLTRWLPAREGPRPQTLLDGPNESPPLRGEDAVREANDAALACVETLLCPTGAA